MQTAERNLARAHAVATSMRIDGWLSQGEAEKLFDLAADAEGPIVEIGSWRGRSTVALALGSMAGNGQPVYAVDSFAGVGIARPTAAGVKPEQPTTAEDLRATLDNCGINGLVKIVPKKSLEAAEELPDFDLLFVDGDHSYQNVADECDAYLPKLRRGGTVVFHDVHGVDPGVVAAFDQKIMTRPAEFLVEGRVDSAVIVRKRAAVRHQVALGMPGSRFTFGTMRGALMATLGASDVRILEPSGNGWDDFNALWARALNLFESGEVSHFAMLHSDVCPQPGWLDMLLHELDVNCADLVSTVIAIKDDRGLTSTGIGDPTTPFQPYKRFTVRECLELPETFDISDCGFGISDCNPQSEIRNPKSELHLLHNTGCWVADLSAPQWRETDAAGCLKIWFDFPTRVCRGPDNRWLNARESEDWFFSRQLAAAGLRTLATRKVRCGHVGDSSFPNWLPWGKYQNGDEDTAPRWRAEPEA